MAGRCVIGVDLGGTNVRAHALYEDGTPAGERVENPSRAQEGTELILDALVSTIRQAAASAQDKVEAVGLAIPGHVDDDAGIVRWAPNFGIEVHGIFQYWQNVPIIQPLVEKTGMRITMGNDANLAALGEYRFGTGRNSANCLAMLTLGTGIGGGVVLGPNSVQGKMSQPRLLVGGNKGGVELGHMIIQAGGLDCNAGTYGALEAYCQRDSIITRAQHKLRRGRASMVRDLVENDLSRVTPRLLTEACEHGDDLAVEVFDEIGMYLGVGIGSIINVFAPDIFAIGGQISKAGKYLFDPVMKSVRNVAIQSLLADCVIGPAEHVDDAGILGGAALALSMP